MTEPTTLEATPVAAPAAPVSAPAAPAVDHSWLPEKFHVKGETGELDVDASSRKLADGYAAAVRRLGSGDARPESADAYTYTPPEEFAQVALDPQMEQDFRERAHEAGLSQGQYEFIMGEYFRQVPGLLQNIPMPLSADQARQELSAVWSDPAEMKRNMDAAERAVAQLPELAAKLREKYATDPLFWQFAAAYGREAREDRPPAPSGGRAAVGNVQAVMQSEAYRNPKHPDHAKVSEQVRQYFASQQGGDALAL